MVRTGTGLNQVVSGEHTNFRGPWHDQAKRLKLIDRTHAEFRGQDKADLAQNLEHVMSPLFWPDDDCETCKDRINAATVVELDWSPKGGLKWSFR